MEKGKSRTSAFTWRVIRLEPDPWSPPCRQALKKNVWAEAARFGHGLARRVWKEEDRVEDDTRGDRDDGVTLNRCENGNKTSPGSFGSWEEIKRLVLATLRLNCSLDGHKEVSET
ncbi:unnamed protein product [Caretta caretta]